MAPLLQSATTPSDGHAVVTVRGDLDSETAAQLWQYLSYLIGQGHHHIVLDLRGMVLIDSAGVDVLTRVSTWTRRKGGELVLRSASPALAEQLELARRAQAHRRHPSAAGHEPVRAPANGPKDHMTDERAMPPDLFHQLTLTILDRSADEGLRTIKSIRSYVDEDVPTAVEVRWRSRC